MYTGWADLVAAPLDIIKYYRKRRENDGRAGEHPEVLPVFHGSPEWVTAVVGRVRILFDALSALQEWVEHKQAPNQMIAAAHITSGVTDRTRPLCSLIRRSHAGPARGGTDEASNFACVTDRSR